MFTRISDQYKNCTAVVIGAGGIGGAIIQLLAESASRIVVGDRDQESLDAIRVPPGPAELITRTVDVRDAASVAEFFMSVRQAVDAPDYLFQTAGVLNLETWQQTTPRTWETAVDVNLNGVFYCVKAATDLMIPRQKGSIVVLGSIAGTKARSGARVNPVYNATKAGLGAFVNAAAMQLRESGIRINCISPGPTATSMMEQQPPQVHEAIGAITLDHRQNHPAEVAELALFVAAHGRFTGEELAIGGGAGLGG